MFHKIVVPIDGSEQSDAAVELALQMAKEGRAAVVFVHAVELSKIVGMTGPAPIDPSAAIDAACRAGNALLRDAKAKAERAGVDATTELPEDHCIASVLEIARQQRADLIVLGSHGRSGLARALLGSVAEGIVRRSSIPVLVCRAAPHLRARPAPASAANASDRASV